MYKICFYSVLFLFAGVHFGHTTVPTVLSIMNLSDHSITLKNTQMKEREVKSSEGVTVLLSVRDGVFILNKDIKTEEDNSIEGDIRIDEDIRIGTEKDEKAGILYPVITAEEESKNVWELTTDGMGNFFLVVADKFKDVFDFYREEEESLLAVGIPSVPYSVMQSSRDCKQLVVAE